jgi:hypothetical protein
MMTTRTCWVCGVSGGNLKRSGYSVIVGQTYACERGKGCQKPAEVERRPFRKVAA